MKKQEHREQFIELRAKGMTFDAISQQLGVSRQSLITWSKDLNDEIANLKQIELEALAEKYFMLRQHRIELFGEQLKRVKAELEQRDLSDVPADKLYTILFALQEKLEAEFKVVHLKKDVETPEYLNETLAKSQIHWTAE